jgi:AraC family transcriptional regulator of adaptative response/methylated-DNA-[protein]-cysteine methyltransferase
MTGVPAGTTASNDNVHDIAYSYGRSSLGDFLAAIDDKGLCAVLLGAGRTSLLQDLSAAFPNKRLTLCDRPGRCDFILNAVTCLIERPAASVAISISMQGSDYKQMVHAALRQTRPGTTKTPEQIAAMIGVAAESAPYVRECAAEDLLAVVMPFHRLQEENGTSPAYRWCEERRQLLLKREAATWQA